MSGRVLRFSGPPRQLSLQQPQSGFPWIWAAQVKVRQLRCRVHLRRRWPAPIPIGAKPPGQYRCEVLSPHRLRSRGGRLGLRFRQSRLLTREVARQALPDCWVVLPQGQAPLKWRGQVLQQPRAWDYLGPHLPVPFLHSRPPGRCLRCQRPQFMPLWYLFWGSLQPPLVGVGLRGVTSRWAMGRIGSRGSGQSRV